MTCPLAHFLSCAFCYSNSLPLGILSIYLPSSYTLFQNVYIHLKKFQITETGVLITLHQISGWLFLYF